MVAAWVFDTSSWKYEVWQVCNPRVSKIIAHHLIMNDSDILFVWQLEISNLFYQFDNIYEFILNYWFD